MPTYSGVEVTAVTPAKHGIETVTVFGTYTVVTALVAADIVRLCAIPAGAIIHDVTLAASASLGATLTATLGDVTVPARYVASATFAQGAAQIVRLNVPAGFGFVTTVAQPLELVIATAATGTTGTVIKAAVQYTMS